MAPVDSLRKLGAPGSAVIPGGWWAPDRRDLVTYRGIQYEGTHQPLVKPEVWLRVQDVLAAHDHAGEKARQHPHYLKGSIFCATCGSRLCFTRNRGNGGTYDYFFCIGKTRYRFACNMRHVSVDKVEEEIEAFYGRFQLSQKRVKAIKATVESELSLETEAAEQEARQQTKLITRLEGEREKLLQAHYAGAVPLDLLKREMERITLELTEARGRLASCEHRYADVQRVLARALELASSCQDQYQGAPNAIRRQFNLGFFKPVYIDKNGRVARAGLTEPFAELLADDLMTD